MSDVNSIGILAALAGGAASFLSPCVLPLVPGYVSYTVGVDGTYARGLKARLAGAARGLPFVAGFSTVFVLLGLGVNAVSQLLLSHRHATEIVGGALIILFGVMLTGVVRLPVFYREFRAHIAPSPQRRVLGGYLLGLAFAAGWTPCIGPILGAIMTLGATGDSGNAMALMLLYAIGLAVPFLLAGAVADGLVARMRPLARFGAWVQRISGVVLILMGIAVATGLLTSFSSWLLATFPAFSGLG
ncbi:MAG TPA: cytochrome c biogenesis protein CcdA [Gammaproteobacteria bacterium]|nr:cytochrome c biogenesis protein CcdA [Gammaproteobacteria bacterium]